MKKTIIFCLISLCLLLSGCGQGKMDELVDMVNENPTVYLGDYEDLQYISSEYNAEADGYYLYYQGKNTSSSNIIRTYNLKAHFYNSNNEWILREVEKELTNSYLNIVGTCWKTTPTKHYSEQYDDFILLEDEIRILDVTEDSETISLLWGTEKIEFNRKHTERDDITFTYVSVDRNEPIGFSYYSLSSNGETRISFVLGNKVTSGWGEMPDLIFTLAD